MRFKFLAVCLLPVIMVLAACIRAVDPPLSSVNIPRYGAAVILSTPTAGPEGVPKELPPPAEVLLMQTPDSPESVLAFYEDLLVKEGWRVTTPATPTPNARRFDWSAGCPIHWMIVTATPGENDLTIVELKRYSLGC